MTRMPLPIAASVMLLAPVTRARAKGAEIERSGHAIVGVTPDRVRWFRPSYCTDGRRHAQVLGDSNVDGVWVDRVNIRGGMRVPHTRTQRTR